VPRKVFITVAERSADQHAANLVRAMRELDPDLEFHALGGELLRAAGATVHHDTVSNAAMGLAALKRAGEVKKLLAWTREFYITEKPDLHICCDSWTMNFHFAKLAKSFGTKVFYYIAPQVWASREGRVQKLKLVADRVACILPFEEAFLRDRGVNATFVGHPLFDELGKEGMRDEGGGMKADEASKSDAPFIPHPSSLIPSSNPSPVIALPCGSRRGIAKNNLPRQLDVAKKIREKFPRATFLIPTTPVTQPIVEPMIAALDYVSAEVNGFDRQIPRCDLAITVSGTATLHIAAHRVPMIVVYYGSRTVWHLLGRWLIKIRTFSIVNLLANNGKDDSAKHIVPEFVPWNGPVDEVANVAIDLISHPEKLAAQRAKIDAMLATIAKPGASMNAARIAVGLLSA
jgi:lipid-A-disaccharide synthase